MSPLYHPLDLQGTCIYGSQGTIDEPTYHSISRALSQASNFARHFKALNLGLGLLGPEVDLEV